MKYELHYASVNLNEDIPVFEFNDRGQLFIKLLEIEVTSEDRHPHVTLINISGVVMVLPSDSFVGVLMCLIPSELPNALIFIQEYTSYEEAYEVALTMHEGESNLVYKD